MRAKWLWATWVHIALAGLILLEVLFLVFAEVFLVPKTMWVLQHTGSGWLGVSLWAPSFFGGLIRIAENVTWWLPLLVVMWALFEWRVRSENKPAIRLSAFLTAALALMVGVALTAVGLVIPLLLLAPALMRQSGL